VSGKEGPATAEFFPCRDNRPRKQNPPKKKKEKNKTQTKQNKQTKLNFYFFSKTAAGNGEMGKIKRRRSTRARIFFGD
jgi:hypothetical protein